MYLVFHGYFGQDQYGMDNERTKDGILGLASTEEEAKQWVEEAFAASEMAEYCHFASNREERFDHDKDYTAFRGVELIRELCGGGKYSKVLTADAVHAIVVPDGCNGCFWFIAWKMEPGVKRHIPIGCLTTDL